MIELLSTVVDLFFPKVCPSCNRPLSTKERSICLHCINGIPERLKLDRDELHERFYGRIKLEEAYAFLLFTRKGLTQKILHSIKYKGNKDLALEMGELFGKRAKDLGFFLSVDVVVPIPLHISKFRFRGYNQSAIIAQGLAKVLEVTMDEKLIVRNIKTDTQTKKSRTDRWKNVSNTFDVCSTDLIGKHILLVDDVVTTGSTLESCGQAALDAGAKKVSLACLALSKK